MEKHYYSVEALEQDLSAFEGSYGLPSEEFFRAYEADGNVPGVSGFDRVVWADLYRALCRSRCASGSAVG